MYPSRNALPYLVLGLLVAGCRPQHQPGTNPSAVRAVSLAPSLTEMVCAVAGPGVLVGRTTACDYPPEVSRIAVIGGFGAPSMEALLKLEPTVILETDLADETLASQMQALGLNRQRITCRTVEDIPPAIERVGSLVNCQPQADALAASIREGLAALRANVPTNRPRVYAEIWHDPMMTAGRNSFLSGIITLAGGQNIGDEVDKDYFQVDPEWVIRQNPDVIFCLYMGRQGSARSSVLARTGWQTIRAVSTGAVHDGLDCNVVLRPGPRVLDGIRVLHDRMTPPSPQ